MAKAWKVTGIEPKKSYRWNAKIVLPVKVEEVYSWAKFIDDPANVSELHNMRISIKRLRYSMEFFAINYGDIFKEHLKVFVDLQSLIGDIHDYDVIQELLKDYRQQLKSEKRGRELIGVDALLRSYNDRRSETYDRFMEVWHDLESRNFKSQLLSEIAGKIEKVDWRVDMTEPKDSYVVGVDMGGTKILAAVVSRKNEIISRCKVATNAQDSSDKVIDRIAGCVKNAVEAANMKLSDIKAIGLGAPGPVDVDRGVVVVGPNIGWSNVPLRDELEKRLDLLTFIENDANLATLGEFTYGSGREVELLVGMFIGTGIGGGIVWNGELVHGVSKTAGELGHMVVVADGPKCGCGNRGCLEAVASRTAITREIRNSLLKKKEKKQRKSLIWKMTHGNLDLMRSHVLARGVKKGDKLMIQEVDRAARYLGIGIGSIVNFLNPDAIVLGGGVVSALGDYFVDRVRATATEYSLTNAIEHVELLTAGLGDDAAAIGGAVLARQKLWQ